MRYVSLKNITSQIAILSCLFTVGCMQFSPQTAGTKKSTQNNNSLGVVDKCLEVYKTKAVPVLGSKCIGCHSSGSFRVSPDLTSATALYALYLDQAYVDPSAANPNESLILAKGAGILGHSGGAVIAQGSQEYNAVRDWIEREIKGSCQVTTGNGQDTTDTGNDPNGFYDF